MQELELKLVFRIADKPAIQNGYSDEPLVVESSVQPSAPVEAVQENGCIFFRLARRPSWNLEIVRLKDERSILQPINIFDVFASIDIPDLCDLVPKQISHDYRHVGVVSCL